MRPAPPHIHHAGLGGTLFRKESISPATPLPPQTPSYYTRPQPDPEVCIQACIYCCACGCLPTCLKMCDVCECTSVQPHVYLCEFQRMCTSMCAHSCVLCRVLENTTPFSLFLCSSDNNSLLAEPKGNQP